MSQPLLVVEKKEGREGKGWSEREGRPHHARSHAYINRSDFTLCFRGCKLLRGQAGTGVLEAGRGKEIEKEAKCLAPQGHGLWQESQLGCSRVTARAGLGECWNEDMALRAKF